MRAVGMNLQSLGESSAICWHCGMDVLECWSVNVNGDSSKDSSKFRVFDVDEGACERYEGSLLSLTNSDP